MNILIKTVSKFFERVLHWLGQHNWRFVSSAAIFLIFFEVFEVIRKGDTFADSFHLIELLIYFALLLLVGILISDLVTANAVQNQTMKILNYKHDISLDLMNLENLDALITRLTALPSTIANVEASRLYIQNTVSEELELEASWNENGIGNGGFHGNCQLCIKERFKDGFLPGVCMPTYLDGADTQLYAQEFCVPIYYGDSLLALVQAKLKTGETLSPTQIKIFENISPEIALALKVNQEQKALSEMRLAKTTLAERRTISAFIHDQLGQNLGYLHLKLDQLGENKNIKKREVQIELKRLRDVANESYEIVRDILKKTRSETVPHLTNLLQEHARTISARANFDLDFKTIGKPISLLPVAQQSIFFTFREILSNVEKHANASKANICVEWHDDGLLDISVTDNGRGFESNTILESDHFGLQIMRESIASINGKLIVNSSIESGTVVSMSIPLKSIMVKPT